MSTLVEYLSLSIVVRNYLKYDSGVGLFVHLAQVCDKKYMHLCHRLSLRIKVYSQNTVFFFFLLGTLGKREFAKGTDNSAITIIISEM